ncbi:Peroxisomal leader peptide-processing protease-like [Oopsacas minuta]|uniref:Peroxisomal leader peptide-processing protease n=1 Tax=Oopsacas minuta TaxID=111878 RepID=A0AAV7JIM7_9METZ|nr:Peroxisomal leader peptide-processing protease-like [Oopsacas minuta]
MSLINPCSLLIQDRFSSGILVSVERGEIFTIVSEYLSDIPHLKVTVWIQLGSAHQFAFVECEAEVIYASSFSNNSYLSKHIQSYLLLVRLTSHSFSHYDFEPLQPYNHLSCSPISQGECVLVVGSPFGPLCPPVLLNNQFRGIVSKTIGSLGMLLIDTFSPNGLSGAPVYILKKEKPYLYGLLIKDFNSALETGSNITLSTIFPVISIMKLLLQYLSHANISLSVFDILLPLSRFSPIINPISFFSYSSIIPRTILSRVVKLQINNTCGTGILITDNICLTCAHVVANLSSDSTIQVSLNYPITKFVPFHIVFTTEPNVYPDIALLVNSKFNYCSLPDKFDINIEVGNEILSTTELYSISYQSSLVEEAITSLALTKGCVSKVVRDGENVLFGQASCCINPGGSGGLVIDRHSYDLLGMVCGFASAETQGVKIMYPQITRFIPFDVILTLLRSGLTKSCNELHKNVRIQKLWNYDKIGNFCLSKL